MRILKCAEVFVRRFSCYLMSIDSFIFMLFIYKMKKHKIIIEYLYRDAGNYKLFTETEIANPKNLTLDDFERWFKSQLIDDLYFIPHDFELIKPQFPVYDPELDHNWCELISVKEEK